MKPPLVIVSGMPGSGKTTLSQVLAGRLFLPLVGKDPIKESLSRVGATDRTFAAMHAVVAAHLEAGVGLVLEAAFHRGLSEDEVRPHLARSIAVDVHCSTPLAVDRFAARAGAPGRHGCHPDLEHLAAQDPSTWPARYGPLDLDIPRLVVDTTDGYDPPVSGIVGWVEERLAC